MNNSPTQHHKKTLHKTFFLSLLIIGILMAIVASVIVLAMNSYRDYPNIPWLPSWWFYQFYADTYAYIFWIGCSLATIGGFLLLINNIYNQHKQDIKFKHGVLLTLLAVSGVMILISFFLRTPFIVDLPQMNIPDPQTPYPYGSLFYDLNILFIVGVGTCTLVLLIFHQYRNKATKWTIHFTTALIITLTGFVMSLIGIMMIRFGLGKLIDNYVGYRICNLLYWMGLVILLSGLLVGLFSFKQSWFYKMTFLLVFITLLIVLSMQITIYFLANTQTLDMDKTITEINHTTPTFLLCAGLFFIPLVTKIELKGK